ncbi:hypothetical protein Q31a_13640 [Aureliella helgolandensis]|uniref:Uncharacterized protein n=1 Tax=Aureliella helgolandensis TaxID=2527968 RepID=A0A518G3F5_9BACT|nr:hypothetical protein Q31a_13640 [Aureliella helgolandensis]
MALRSPGETIGIPERGGLLTAVLAWPEPHRENFASIPWLWGQGAYLNIAFCLHRPEVSLFCGEQYAGVCGEGAGSS